MTVSFGDADAAVVDILLASDDVTAFTGVVVSSDLIGLDTNQRWIRVARTGGTPTLWMHLDNPIIAVEVFAEDKAAAYDMAAAARSAVFAARGVYTGFGLSLYDVSDEAGLTYSLDDTRPDIARYEFALSLVTRPSS